MMERNANNWNNFVHKWELIFFSSNFFDLKVRSVALHSGYNYSNSFQFLSS